MTTNTWPFNAGSPGGEWTVNALKHHRNVSGALIILIDVDLFQLPQISSQKDTAGLERVLSSVVKNRGKLRGDITQVRIQDLVKGGPRF